LFKIDVLALSVPILAFVATMLEPVIVLKITFERVELSDVKLSDVKPLIIAVVIVAFVKLAFVTSILDDDKFTRFPFVLVKLVILPFVPIIFVEVIFVLFRLVFISVPILDVSINEFVIVVEVNKLLERVELIEEILLNIPLVPVNVPIVEFKDDRFVESRLVVLIDETVIFVANTLSKVLVVAFKLSV
jgi:hypothetical protein